MWFYTGKGDDGKTYLFNGREVKKSSLLLDCIGTLDEAIAHIGVAICFSSDEHLISILRIIQNQISMLMGIIAGAGSGETRENTIGKKNIQFLEKQINHFGKNLENPKEFVFAGSTLLGAYLDVTRTVIRRAERLWVKLLDENNVKKNFCTIYLNRLSSLFYILRLYVDQN